MTDQTRNAPKPQTVKETGAVLLALGGVVAAVGAVSPLCPRRIGLR